MTNPINDLFSKALGVAEPRFVKEVDFDAAKREMIIRIDFVCGTHFPHPRAAGEHKVHDTEIKRLRHLNFFQRQCILEVWVPRVKLPDGVARVEPDWFGKLSGFTLLFEALVLALAQHMPFNAVAQTVGESWHRVHAICERYVDLAVAETDLSETSSIIIDETSYRRGHRYLTLVVDADAHKVVHVSRGASSDNVAGFVQPCEIITARRTTSHRRLQSFTAAVIYNGRLSWFVEVRKMGAARGSALITVKTCPRAIAEG